MLTLHTFGPAFGLPDPSPFVTKADVLLKMSELPYQTKVGDVRKAPKHKLPVLEDDGQLIPDSTFIRWHLESKHGIRFDWALTAEQRGVAWALEKMLEEHLYWAIVDARWMNDRNFFKGPVHFFKDVPALMRSFVVRKIRADVKQRLWGQGFGRHTRPEVERLGKASLDALVAILGSKPFLFGEEPSGADATAYAFVESALCELFETPIRTHAESQATLVDYRGRMRARFYPELMPHAQRVAA